ncbi:Tn3 family transposase [Streptomyces lydicus]|uniref:Tn3 family transposase n=1 Tax=Streptomyces lydicus TaxID=47763 RepID=UPI00379D2BD5
MLFRDQVGRVIRTVQLLRHLSDALLRRRETAATNKVESFGSPSGTASATRASSPTTTPSRRRRR